MSVISTSKQELNLSTLYNSKCASLIQFQSDPRMAQVPKAIRYVQKLYKNSSIGENDPEFKTLINKCEMTINLGTTNLVSHLLDLANYLRNNQYVSNSPQIEETQKTSDVDEPVEANEESNEKIETISNDKNVIKEKKRIVLKDLTKVDQVLEEKNEILMEDTEKLVSNDETPTTSAGTPSDDQEISLLSKEDIKNLERIKKLDKFCIDLNQKIIEYENREVSFDELESEESSYLNECKLKNRFVKAYKTLVKYCKKYPHLITNDTGTIKASFGQFSKKIKFNSTRYNEINTHITLCLNKNKEFPDYCEVLEWVSSANTQHRLGLDEKRLSEISLSSFEDICKILKSRRISDERQIQLSRIESIKSVNAEIVSESDPADTDKNLQVILDSNKKIADQKCDEVINSFVVKQENNEDFEIDEKEEEEEETEEDKASSKDSINDDADTSLKTTSDLESDIDDNVDNDTNDEPNENLPDKVEEATKGSKRTSEKAPENINKKFRPENSDTSNDSMKLRPRKTKPTIVECSSAIQSAEECIVLD